MTEFEYRLHPVGPILAGGLLLFDRSEAESVLQRYRDFMEAAPDEIGGAAALMSAPPAPFVPQEMQFKPAVGIIALYVGDVEEGMAALAPLRGLGTVKAEMLGPIPYTVLQTLIDGGNPWGVRGYFKAAFMSELSDGAIHDYVQLANDAPSPLTGLLLEPMGGAFARVGEDDTALGHRATKWCWHNLSVWMDPAQDDVNVEFSRLVATAMAPHSLQAVHPNYVSDTGSERVRSFYSPQTYDRLVALKRTWDPENVFHLNQNITP